MSKTERRRYVKSLRKRYAAAGMRISKADAKLAAAITLWFEIGAGLEPAPAVAFDGHFM